MRTLQVSELNAQIKGILESTFMDICVEGEIASFTLHTSGHIYLTLKDEQSNIRCVMFRGNAKNLKFELEVGQFVLIKGALSVFSPKGEYQILCKSITPSGVGELTLAFLQLKEKLAQKGYFDSQHKKTLPFFPRRIALLTSATGAAKEDMLKVAKKRWNLLEIVLFNTLVQGEGAKDSIVDNLKLADSFYGSSYGFDVIILGRGGGSIEDMWAFNEEIVADAIFHARTPIVSAVGHEIDVFISDFVADLRAPTPSAAMEMILPDQNEWLRILDETNIHYTQSLERYLLYKQESLSSLKERFKEYHFESQYRYYFDQISYLCKNMHTHFASTLTYRQLEINALKGAFETSIQSILTLFAQNLHILEESLKVYDPHRICTQGYAQITQDSIVRQLSEILLDEEFELTDTEHNIRAKRIG